MGEETGPIVCDPVKGIDDLTLFPTAIIEINPFHPPQKVSTGFPQESRARPSCFSKGKKVSFANSEKTRLATGDEFMSGNIIDEIKAISSSNTTSTRYETMKGYTYTFIKTYFLRWSLHILHFRTINPILNLHTRLSSKFSSR